jgi:HK97 family phage major capsid protein
MSVALIKRLFEERSNLVSEARGITDLAETEKRDLSGEEETRYQTLNEELSTRDARIKQLLDAEQRESDAAEARAQFEKLDRPGAEEQRAEVGTELREFLRGEKGRTLEVRADKPIDFRALSRLSAAAGQNTVKTSFLEQLYAHLIEVSGVMQAGPTVLNTNSGEDLQIPKTTAHSTAVIVAEAGAIGASDPTFGQVTLKSYKYGLLIQISRELIDDTSVDIESYLAMQAGRACGNAFGAHAITGTGGGVQPTGVVTGATVGKTGGAGVAGIFTSDDLVDLYFSVIAPYRNSTSCGWMMKDATLATVRKFKGSDGQYIWQPSYTIGEPDKILGKPVHTDPNVAAVALSAKSVVFGDFSQYVARFVNGLRFERSDDYAFNADLVTYRCLLRADGVLVDQTGAVKVFQGNAA